MGLVISKRIIELMDGKIWVESELGKGARFIFTVNVMLSGKKADAADSALETKEYDSVGPGDAAGEFEGKRLLVAEDIEINREILIALLENSGLVIECADNGEKALSMVANATKKYDIVFMDMQMPQMDGLEATRRIRALPRRKGAKLPIIAMTANVFKEDVEKCLEAGMNDHLGKPLEIDKVIEKLRKYLK